ncbi:MAG: site-specific DNA-methyltransferase [Candidatus Bathyarchaeia archaeon]
MELKAKVNMLSKKHNITQSILLIDNIISPESLLKPFRGTVKITSVPNLSNYDTIAIYDAPTFLPFWFNKFKMWKYDFKYHIVVYFDPLNEFKANNLLVSHVGLLLLSKKFAPNKVRIPHQYCSFCKKPLKDWGGKTHLMHPEGSLISDVWKDMPLTYKDIVGRSCPPIVIKRLENMFGKVDIIKGEKEVLHNETQNIFEVNSFPAHMKNIVLEGDAIEVLKGFPSNSVDMIFIDPPYNLGKKYLNYEDERKDYVEWSLKWLNECFKILKPNGSLFLLNIPKWAHEILVELLPNYYLIRWIVWDETAEPRGKLIPAHYALLWLSKTSDVKTYPLKEDQDSMNYCLRIKCAKVRRSLGIRDKISVRDVRWDIHRIKHRHKRFKFHPVQLPERLLRFLIELTTRDGDIVLDPMVGTGTTVVVAKKLKRAFVGIDIDPTYVEIANKRLAGELEEILEEPSKNNLRDRKFGITKKWVQVEMEKFAKKFGRLPTIDEASLYLGVSKDKLSEIFPNWSKALKLAKLTLQTDLNRYAN